MPKRAVFERSRRELSLEVSVGLHVLLVVEQSSLESQSRGCAKTPILRVCNTLDEEDEKNPPPPHTHTLDEDEKPPPPPPPHTHTLDLYLIDYCVNIIQ